MSTGFWVEASAGRKARNAACVSAPRVGISSPKASAASAAMMAGPPAFDTMPTLRPAGRGARVSATTASKSSSRVSQRRMPV
jgi:hypothetical protein